MVSKKESGQTIILIAIVMIGLVAIAALMIDGGNAYFNRRNAQTAADAAVLAAAYEKCVNMATLEEMQAVVDDYAVTQNKATSATVTIDPPDSFYPKGKITVVATIDGQTFFAKLLNKPIIEVKATASAGCFLPGAAENLLPIAWTCREPIGGDSNSCILHNIPYPIWEEIVASGFDFEAPGNILDFGDEVNSYTYYNDLAGTAGEGKMIYLVMDDDSFDPNINCIELNTATDATPGVGAINCDFNDDGILDVEGGANRGWLLLDGTGASDLTSIMLNGYPGVLELPQWFPGKSGVSNSVFINAEAIRFRISLIPVYNAMCEDTTDYNLTTDCPDEFISGDLIQAGTGSVTYYRVPAVGAFVVTCVSKGNPDYCPGKDLSGVDNNTSTIEGYFISGYVGGEEIGHSGFDLGVYIISLTN